MYTLGILMAATVDIPEATDKEWFGRCCAWITGTSVAWERLWRSLPQDQRPKQKWFNSPNLTVNAADYMAFREPAESFKPHIDRQFSAWESQGRPDIVVENGPAQYCAASQTVSRLGLDRLVFFRCILQTIPLKRLKHGGKYGLLANQGDLFRFDMDHELDLVEELTRANGGDSLVMWTFGHTIQILLFREQAGTRPQRYRRSIRMMRPSDQSRSAGLLGDLQRQFEGSSLTPDWKAIGNLLAAPQVDLEPWFEAFGLPGAEELVPKDCAAQWDALDTVGASLLRGETPDAALVKRLNSVLGKIGDGKVPSKPGKGMARKLFGAAFHLRKAAGLPVETGRWQERYAAAQMYDDITSSDALERLTVGVGKQGLGQSASLARLSAYYPAALCRDGWFWSLAAQEAETWNGHAFVGGMETLAEAAHSAGFTLVLMPSSEHASFREASGIEAEPHGSAKPEDERGWAAEAFLDLPGLLKADVGKTAGAWFSKKKVNGLVVRCDADGSSRISAWTNGQPSDDPANVLGSPAPQSLAEQAKALDPVGALRAFGFQELLRPLDISQERQSKTDQKPSSRLELAATGDWPSKVPPALPPEVVMLIAVKTGDSAYVEQVTTDLAAGAKLPVKRDGSSIQLSSRDRIRTAEIEALLGDLPPGSVYAASAGNGIRFRTVVQ